MKFAFLDEHLVGSLAWYRQERTQLQQAGGVTTLMGTRSKGGEAEIRYVLNPEFQPHPGRQPAAHHRQRPRPQLCLYSRRAMPAFRRANGFGGAYVTFDFSELPGKAGNYEDTLIPHAVISPYLTYTSDDQQLGRDLRRHLCFPYRTDRARSDHLSRLT